MSISSLTTQRKVTKGLRIKIEAILEHVVSKLDPDQVYLIGSMHRGIIHDHSDLDLVVVTDCVGNRSKLLLNVLPTRPHKDIPLDLHIFDRTQFAEMKNVGGLCFEAFNHGREVYLRGSL